MNKIGKVCRRTLKSPELILILSWIVFAVAHALFPVTNGDDAWFAQILAGDKATFQNWLDFLIRRYHEWSSRSLIEGLLILTTRLPLLWRVGDTLVCISITVLLSRLFNPERSRVKYFIIVACVFLFPIAILFEAGYIATTLNYTWPFAAALLAFTPIIKRFFGREVLRWEYAIAFPMMLLAGCQELICATSVLALLVSLVYRFIVEKKLPRFEVGMLAIALTMLAYALTCPGNDNRTMLETATWFPAYADLDLFQKIELGFSSMCQMLFLKQNVFVFAFSAVITLAAFVKTKCLWQRMLAALPTLFVLTFGLLGDILAPKIEVVRWLCGSVGLLGTNFQISDPISWIPDLIFVTVFALLLISLRITVKDHKRYWFFFTVLALGAASRMAMALSPTIWASGERIFAFLYASMAVVMGGLLYDVVTVFKSKADQD